MGTPRAGRSSRREAALTISTIPLSQSHRLLYSALGSTKPEEPGPNHRVATPKGGHP